MRQPENIRAVDALDIDMMGFIMYPPSPRYFFGNLENICQEQKLLMDTRSKRTGVFVDEKSENILNIAHSLQLDFIQLHGNEKPDQCKLLKEEGFKIVKVFSVKCNEQPETATRMFSRIEKEYGGMADFFLFDTKCISYGGSGIQFDWNILHHYKGNTPFFLSGGIDISSVPQIKEFHHDQLAGVDLNSGFEISPALKNIKLLESFITEIRK